MKNLEIKPKKKYYAHKGSSSDNAFTTYNSEPTRIFMAFDSRKERQAYREILWRESGKSQNLIDCSRKMVLKYYGKNFYIAKNKEVQNKY